ncbi:hypothetical protein BOW53_15785 [Solemya pervernicosa gill symbiont]|uniref:RND efflux pump membrane fusion protein barrel-sandwich domain-containing protein n=2 Tax=Gammaproteobacteria incertae sedis TaxID=118884 RepID=A0A1T2KZU7_9GAMM|nr:hypothetical protein BOW53_15785 [Solemya pervernicosa gill symbiont]
MKMMRLLISTLLFGASVVSVQGAEESQTVVTAQPAFRQVSLTGFSRAHARLPLVAESSGKVLSANADVGDVIGPKGFFARLDPTFIKLDIEANRIQQKQLRSRIDYDKLEAKRYRELSSKGSASKSRLDELEQQLRDSRLRLAELKVHEKTLAERLQRTAVTAPIGWRVTSRLIEPGQRVNEGEVLGEVADFSQLLVPFALTPSQFAAIRQQQDQLELTLPDWGVSVAATLYRINPGFDQDTRKIVVELQLAGELPERRGGLRLLLDLKLPERSGAVTLPAAAVEESYDEFWLTREDGERIRVVQLGVHNTDSEQRYLRLASPQIKAGDRFILRGGE